MATNPPLPQSPEEDDAYYRAILLDLVDRGADLARRVHEAASTPGPTPALAPEDPTIAFERIARTIRRTIALARHIAEHPANATTARPHQAATRAAAREKIIRTVEDAIDLKHRADRTAGAESLHAELHAELHERLEDPELERDLATRPINDIIDEIARDLGVARRTPAAVWKRRTPNDLAALRARAAAPSAPPTPSLHQIHRSTAPP